MTQPEPPEAITGDEKKDTGKRQKHVYNIAASACQIKKRIVLKKSGRYHIGKEFQYSFAIDRQRITAELSAAVGKHVHKFKTLCREKAE